MFRRMNRTRRKCQGMQKTKRGKISCGKLSFLLICFVFALSWVLAFPVTMFLNGEQHKTGRNSSDSVKTYRQSALNQPESTLNTSNISFVYADSLWSQFGTWVGPFDSFLPSQSQFDQSVSRSKPLWSELPNFESLEPVRQQSCRKKGAFVASVQAKRIVVVLHEGSLTGAPLAVAELAAEALRCTASVAAVALNKKGGLLEEMTRQGIGIVRDKRELSWKVADEADLVVVSSAASVSWIEGLLTFSPSSSSKIVWWLMENRREYYELALPFLGRVAALVFISESQEALWREWSKEDAIELASIRSTISLSLGEDMSRLAGIAPDSSAKAVQESASWRKWSRRNVRGAFSLTNDDDVMVVGMVSSVTPGKGQLRLIKAALNLLTKPRSCLAGQKDDSWHSFKLLIGSMHSKSNKEEYLKRIQQTLQEAGPLSKEVILWVNSTLRVAPIYTALDVYVMNAQGIGETFGRVTVEAMAFGLPVLGTSVGGTAEIVLANETGLLHPVGSIGEAVLADHLHYLRCHKSRALEMGRKGRQRVQEVYLDSKMYEGLGKVFGDVLRCSKSDHCDQTF